MIPTVTKGTPLIIRRTLDDTCDQCDQPAVCTLGTTPYCEHHAQQKTAIYRHNIAARKADQ